jgi:hypothetical protein
MTAITGRARVLADAAARGLEIDVVERPSAYSLEQAAALLGLEARQIVKSLVVRRHTPEGAPNEYRIALGAGEQGFGAFVDADALIAALGATVAEIS